MSPPGWWLSDGDSRHTMAHGPTLTERSTGISTLILKALMLLAFLRHTKTRTNPNKSVFVEKPTFVHFIFL